MTHTAALLTILADALTPKPKLTVGEWAERYRTLPDTQAEPGPWRNSRTPWAVEPMEALSAHHPAEVVVLQWGSQLAKSETGNNWFGYVVDHEPGTMLMVQPTVSMCEQYSKQRIAPMTEVPPLAGKIRDARERDSGNTTLLKEFPGGSLLMRGANSPSGLSGLAIRYAFFDEVDQYEADIDDQGDPITVGSQRTRTFVSGRKILITSTPTIKGASRIEKELSDCTVRHYFVPCPLCGTFQVLQWTPTEACRGGVVWEPQDPRGTAAYQCAECMERIPATQRDRMVAEGVWRVTQQGDPLRWGYKISSLYSPWISWGELAEMFLRAKREGPSKLKPFVNLQLGETWDVGEVSAVEARGLMLRLEKGWGAGYGIEVPEAACVLTAGVDVQSVRGSIIVEVVAWGEGLESWSIDYLRIDGDPTNPPPKGVWGELDRALSRTYMHPTLGPMTIKATCVDTGDNSTNCYAFVRPRQKRRVWGVKGASEDNGKPIWPDKVSKSNKGKIDLRVINVSQAKEDVYWRLRVNTPGPGYSHFPAGRDEAYFDELTSEALKVEYKGGRGRKKWVLAEGRRNEALDVRVYAYAAVLGLIRQKAITLTAPRPRPNTQPTQAQAVIDSAEHAVQTRAEARPAPRPKRKARSNWWGSVLEDW